MTEVPMARIPFGPDQELNIADAGRWMRFMAVVQIVGGAIGLVLLLIGMFVLGLIVAGTIPLPDVDDPELGAMKAFLVPMVSIALAIAGAIILVSIWAGALLYRAGDAFNNVAMSDEADQDYLAQAFGLLKKFFIVEAVFGVLTALQAVLAIFNFQSWGQM